MLSMLQDKLMVRSEGVKGRTVDEVMEGAESQIRLSGEQILGEQHRDQFRGLFNERVHALASMGNTKLSKLKTS